MKCDQCGKKIEVPAKELVSGDFLIDFCSLECFRIWIKEHSPDYGNGV
jgi:hypothetical protein